MIGERRNQGTLGRFLKASRMGFFRSGFYNALIRVSPIEDKGGEIIFQVDGCYGANKLLARSKEYVDWTKFPEAQHALPDFLGLPSNAFRDKRKFLVNKTGEEVK